ncbi:MAG: hypothetical protein GSR80_000626 [Desulfurococcales archaeon]|nr:hypothetical protein [Desulfurococcales archaeon]
MAEVRVYCVSGGRVRRRHFDDRRDALDYAEAQARKGILCFVSG